MTKIPGIILAGGLATRMGGGDKALLPLGGGTLLDEVIARLQPQCAALALNANGDITRFARFGLQVLPDPIADWPGPLAGVLAGLDWAAELGAEAVATVAVDTPFFPRDLVEQLRMAASAEGRAVALAASADGSGILRRHPTFGLWPVYLRDELRDFLASGERKVSLFAEAHGVARVVFEDDGGDPFFNVNTPDDLAAAQKRASDVRTS